jgi:hypothetical protein
VALFLRGQSSTLCRLVDVWNKSNKSMLLFGRCDADFRLVPCPMSSPIALPSCLHEERAEAAGTWAFAVMQQTGPVPDVITYCAAIFACTKSGPRQQALGLLR